MRVNQLAGQLLRRVPKGDEQNWRVAFADNPNRWLAEHGVEEAWAVECGSEDEARAVEHVLIECGLAREGGGGSEQSVFVYVYQNARS